MVKVLANFLAQSERYRNAEMSSVINDQYGRTLRLSLERLGKIQDGIEELLETQKNRLTAVSRSTTAVIFPQYSFTCLFQKTHSIKEVEYYYCSQRRSDFWSETLPPAKKIRKSGDQLGDEDGFLKRASLQDKTDTAPPSKKIRTSGQLEHDGFLPESKPCFDNEDTFVDDFTFDPVKVEITSENGWCENTERLLESGTVGTIIVKDHPITLIQIQKIRHALFTTKVLVLSNIFSRQTRIRTDNTYLPYHKRLHSQHVNFSGFFIQRHRT